MPVPPISRPAARFRSREKERNAPDTRSFEKKSEKTAITFSTIFVPLLEIRGERRERGEEGEVVSNTRFTYVLLFRKCGSELDYERKKGERRFLGRKGGFERVPLGRSAVEKAEKLAEPGQADTVGRVSGEILSDMYAEGSRLAPCIYIYMRSCPRSETVGGEKKVGSSLFHPLSRKITTRNLDVPRIKLARTRTGINFAAERARVEIGARARRF